jgi:hypothetical protein
MFVGIFSAYELLNHGAVDSKSSFTDISTTAIPAKFRGNVFKY